MTSDNIKKIVAIGSGYVMDKNWNKKKMTKKQAYNYGRRHNSLASIGFDVFIFDASEHYRINYGKKV